MRRVATIWARSARSGWSCFSNRDEASDRRLRSREVRRMLGPFQVAASIRTEVVESETSDTAPPMTPATAAGPLLSQTRTVSDETSRSIAVEGRHLLAVLRRPHEKGAVGNEVEVEGVHRLAGEPHHVVGDVDHVVDRPLAGGDQPGPQPERRGTDGHIGEGPGGERGQRSWFSTSTETRLSTSPPVSIDSPSHGAGARAAPVIAWASRATP